MKKIFEVWIILFTLTILTFTTGCRPTKIPEIRGTVIDAETKQPIEGAAVLFDVVCEMPSPGGGVDRTLAIKRVKTDKEGKYFIPSQKVRLRTIVPFGQEKLHRSTVIVYTEGYKLGSQVFSFVTGVSAKKEMEQKEKKHIAFDRSVGISSTRPREFIDITNKTHFKNGIEYNVKLTKLKTAEEYLRNTYSLQYVLSSFHASIVERENDKKEGRVTLYLTDDEAKENHDLIKKEYKNILEKFTESELQKQIDFSGYGRMTDIKSEVEEKLWGIGTSEKEGYTGWAPSLNRGSQQPEINISSTVLMNIIFSSSEADNLTTVMTIETLGGKIKENKGRAATVEIPSDKVSELSKIPGIKIIQECHQPKKFNDLSAKTMNAQTLWQFSNDTKFTGEGEIINITDAGLYQQHPDLQDKLVAPIMDIAEDGNTSDSASHGTHSAGSICGTGAESNGQYKGIAYNSKMTFQAMWDNNKQEMVLPLDLDGTFQQGYNYGARIFSNGWGVESETEYRIEDMLVDEFVYNNPDAVVVFAAGNNGKIASPALSKNVIAVGASLNDIVADLSSVGPSLDGRIKPDIVAPGVSVKSCADGGGYIYRNGTSVSASLTAGAVALLREYYKMTFNHNPTASLIKATLINSAKDLGATKEKQGYGRIDLSKCISTDTYNTVFEDNPDNKISTKSEIEFKYIVKGTEPFNTTLVWTDYPAEPMSAKQLVNDLDLEILTPTNSTYYLNDHTNNVEKIVVTNPSEGTYTLKVKGKNIPTGYQNFSLVASAGYLQKESEQVATSSAAIIISSFPTTVQEIQPFEIQIKKVNNDNSEATYWIYQTSEPIKENIEINVEPGKYKIYFKDLTTGTTYLYLQQILNLTSQQKLEVKLFHKPIVHEWISAEAIGLLNRTFPLSYSEIIKDANIEVIKSGSVVEDDPVWRTRNHFWNPNDPNTVIDIASLLARDGTTTINWAGFNGDWPDGNCDMVSNNNSFDWTDAVAAYKSGNKTTAYTALGHVAHLLEDITSPAHTHLIQHLFGDGFEVYFGNEIVNGSLPAEYSQGAVFVPISNLYTHFKSLAEQSHGSYVVDNQPLVFERFYVAHEGANGEYGIDTPTENDLHLMGRHLFPKAIGYTAGLIEYFAKQVDPLAPTIEVRKNDASGEVIFNNGAANTTTIFVKATDPADTQYPTASGIYRIVLSGPVSSTQTYTGLADGHTGSHTETYTFTNLTEGNYTLTVNDGLGNVSVHQFTIDTSSPTEAEITIGPGSADMPDGSVTNQPAQTITGKAEPGSIIVIYVNGKMFSGIADGNGDFSIPITLVEGPNVIKIVVKDKAGNMSPEITFTIILDTKPPDIWAMDLSITNPCHTDNGKIKANITFGADDQITGIKTISWDGGSNSYDPTVKAVVLSADFGAGEHTITATDGVGNTQSKTFSITIQGEDCKFVMGNDTPDDNESVSVGSPPSESSNPDGDPVAMILTGVAGYTSRMILATGNDVRAYPPMYFSTATMITTCPILVIPSGGLMGLSNVESFKKKLSDYVGAGGTIICFSQQHGYDFNALPRGNEVSGYGWQEDQSCQSASVYINEISPVFNNQTKVNLDCNVDGYFTGWPVNAKVLLRRTKNNMPALIEYDCGQGKVIATTLYSDFSYAQGSLSSEEKTLIQNLITYAKDPTIQPTQSLQIAKPIECLSFSEISLTEFNQEQTNLSGNEEKINENKREVEVVYKDGRKEKWKFIMTPDNKLYKIKIKSAAGKEEYITFKEVKKRISGGAR